MPKYSIMFANQTSSTAAKTVLAAYMLTDATRNMEVVEVICTGSGSVAAADIQSRCDLAGCTFAATGVSTSITPIPFNPTGPAALGNYGTNESTEPTAYSAVRPVSFGFNQRGGMRWAVPQGEGFRAANYGTTEKGCGVLTIASAAGNLDANMHFWQAN